MRSDSQLLPTLLSTMMIWYFGVAACHGQANPDYQLSLSSGSGQQGTTVDLIVSFDNTGETVRAWAFGVCSDPDQLTIIDVISESGTTTSNNGGMPDFIEINMVPEGWSANVIIDLFGSVGLDPGLGYPIHRATYALDGVEGAVASVEFCVYPGVPQVTPVVFIGAISETPVLIDGAISIGAGFVRGDCNGLSGGNLADPIFLLGFLFVDPTLPPCLDACDVNDDGSINIADVIYHLAYLFHGFSPPLPPWPFCGDDPTADSLDCDLFGACP